MKPRTCFLWLWIANDAGRAARYSVRPLTPCELSPLALAGFRLVNLSRDPSPEYRVRLLDAGEVACNCRQFDSAGACKHGDALTAAGLLPCALVGLLQQRTKLLDAAEAKLKDTEDNLKAAQARADANLRIGEARLKETEAKLEAVAARAVQLQTALAAIPPARPTRRRPAKTTAA